MAVALGLAACGDGNDSSPATAGLTEPVVTKTARELLPSLADLGYRQTAPETIPGTGALDIAFSVYERPDPPRAQARVEVRVYPDEAAARGDYRAQAEGWKNPPPGLFGGDPANVEGPALAGMDEATAYLATNRDPQGFRLWTDIYRIGRVIVVAHALGQNEADVTSGRTGVGDRIREALR